MSFAALLLFIIFVAVAIVSMAMIKRAGQRPSSHAETAALDDRPVKKKRVAAVLGVFGALAAGILLFGMSGHSKSWRLTTGTDPFTGAETKRITGFPETYSGPKRPTMLVECRAKDVAISINFGVPMKNSHKGTKVSLVTVELKLDTSDVIPLAFSPSEDWTRVSVLDYSTASGALEGIGVTIDNLIFQALGIDNAPRADWTASKLFGQMRSSNSLSIRASTRAGQTISAQYLLEDLKPLYEELPVQCR
ncbi:hypothetical protein F9L33_11920 [Amylibacter sp. SFDW26]|uniref:hypothetical protein n=1 Tax=Amylibacter sp. SFDW26 TaxID=2652722 RepID=UPI001261B9EB|nr:hypothetical protein [Amylibacter sp. SFDW26]KAB7613306.1 hypothetical protein F9L33_11920 [Amylibacter sp. SFDW26]